MSDNESTGGIEKAKAPKAPRAYVRTPARDEAIRKMREAREKSMKEKQLSKTETVQQPVIEDPTPKMIGKPKKKEEAQPVDEEEEEKIIVKKKPTKKKPTVVYIESESESEPEQIIIKKTRSKSSKSKKRVVESESESESESEEEEEYHPIPHAIHQRFIEPPRLRFL